MPDRLQLIARATVALPAAALVAAALLAGCKTPTKVEKVGPDTWVVCDSGPSDGCDGANPEKGLRSTCPTEGRSIRDYRPMMRTNAIVVTCGERLESEAKEPE